MRLGSRITSSPLGWVPRLGHLVIEITAGEKGETSTCLSCINAGGGYGPNLIIFKGKRMKADWLFGAPENAFLRMSDNGWINTELFTEWGKFFLRSLPKDDPRPYLLLVDGHSSHVYNIEFLNLMKANNVCVFSLPPHTTHYLQPADRALFKSLKHFWRIGGRRVTRESGGKRLDRALFMSLLPGSKLQRPQMPRLDFIRDIPIQPRQDEENYFHAIGNHRETLRACNRNSEPSSV